MSQKPDEGWVPEAEVEVVGEEKSEEWPEYTPDPEFSVEPEAAADVPYEAEPGIFLFFFSSFLFLSYFSFICFFFCCIILFLFSLPLILVFFNFFHCLLLLNYINQSINLSMSLNQSLN